MKKFATAIVSVLLLGNFASASFSRVQDMTLFSDEHYCVVFKDSKATVYQDNSPFTVRRISNAISVSQESLSTGSIHIAGEGFDYKDTDQYNGQSQYAMRVETLETRVLIGYLRKVDKCPFDVSKARD